MPVVRDRRRCCCSGCWLKSTRFGTAHLCGRQRPGCGGSRRRRRRARAASWSMSSPAAATGSPACSSAPRPAAAIRWSAIRCCCQMFAAVVVGGTRLGGGQRRAGRHGVRRLHPDDRRQHPAGAERLGLLLDDRRGRDPDPGGARRLAHRTLGPGAAASRGSARASRPGAPARCRRSSTGADRRLRHRRGRARPRAGDAPRRPSCMRHAETLRYALPAYVCLVAGPRRHADLARQHAAQSRLLELAARAVLLPRHPGARPGHGDPHRRPRPLGALDDRPLRHPARRHGQRLGRRARLCAAARARCIGVR